MDTTIKKSTYLSTAIAHLLSIISNEATKVAGHARAVRSELNTVSMAPSFINWIAITTILTAKYIRLYNEATLLSNFCNNTSWCHLFPCKPCNNTSASTLPALSDLLQQRGQPS